MDIDTVDNEIEELSHQVDKNNWDGNGALKLDISLIPIAESLIAGLQSDGISEQPEVFPTTHGGIQFEWEFDNGDYIEIELLTDKRIRIYKNIQGVSQPSIFDYSYSHVSKYFENMK